MANTVKLKKSSVLGKIPQSADLDYGELALNYADGKLYFKDSSNVIQLFGASSATDTLTNKTLNNSTINNTSIGATTPSTGAFTTLNASGKTTLTGEVLISNATGSGGAAEGGELHFAIPTSNTTLSGPIAIDIYENRIRFFETTGTNRGAYIDLTAAGAGAGSNLLTGGSQGTSLPSQTGNAGKYLTTDGSNLSWAAVAGSGGFPVVDAGLITESINMSAMVDAGTIV